MFLKNYKPPPIDKMGFWTGVADYFGLKPIEDAGDFFQDLGSVASMGLYNARENDFNPSNLLPGGPVAAGIAGAVSDHWSDNVPSTMGGVMETLDNLREDDLLDYAGNLFQTDADAALDQASVNDMLSEAAWQRSEESADRAVARARELRQTYAADLMKGYQDAGLNPVLAASGGFGGVSSSAPQGTSQAATSSKADGLNAANLMQAIASILSGAGSLIGGLNPLKGITSIDSNGALSRSMYSYGRR